MKNQEIIDEIKKNCVNTEGREMVELLEQRWNAFWEEDYHTLARQRARIQSLEFELSKVKNLGDLEEQRAKVAELKYEIRKLHSANGSKEESREIESLRDHVKNLTWQNKYLRRKVELLERENDRLQEYAPRIKAGDAIQVIPPFEIFDHKNRPVSSLTVAREVRLAHQAAHI